jgi:hypothetical protein
MAYSRTFQAVGYVIAYPEKITYPRLSFGKDQAAIQLPRARYEW